MAAVVRKDWLEQEYIIFGIIITVPNIIYSILLLIIKWPAAIPSYSYIL